MQLLLDRESEKCVVTRLRRHRPEVLRQQDSNLTSTYRQG